MPILRLIARVRNVIPFRTGKPRSQRKFRFIKLQELAERDDFSEILTAAGVPDKPIPEVVSKKWSEGREFDASKFDDAAYKVYETDFSKK